MNIAKADGIIELNQSRYAREIYNTYRDQEVVVKVASTPMKDNIKLSKANADPEYMNGKDLRGLVGSLLYLTMVTRPDICFAVKELSRMLDSGGREVWAAGQHLLEYKISGV